MSCSTNLVADVVNDCSNRPIKGIYPTAWILPFDGRQYKLSENKLQLLASPQGYFTQISAEKFALNVGSEIATSEVKQNGFKHKFIGILSQIGNADLDKMDGIIVVVKKGTKYFAYGIQNGLWKASQVRTANDNSGLVTVEYSSRADMEEDYSEYEFDESTGLFSTIPPDQFINDYNMITGLSITDGDDFNYSIYADKVYAMMPNGDYYTESTMSTSGSVTGYINIFLSKTATSINLENSEVKGIFTSSCNDVYLGGCKFNALEIEYILKRIVDLGGIDGNVDLSLGTNAVYGTWTDAAKDYKLTLVSRGWTVTNNV